MNITLLTSSIGADADNVPVFVHDPELRARILGGR